MALVLAIEPDARQAAILKRVVRERAQADIAVVDSKDAAIAAIGAQIPDLILVTALLSPRDEEELVGHLRTLEDADHLQTITIPLLATAGLAPEEDEGGFFSRAFRRKKASSVVNGCDPWTFADQVTGYLRTAAEVRATLAAERAYARAHGIPNLTNDLAELRSDTPAEAESSGTMTSGEQAGEAESAENRKPSVHDPEYAFSWRSSKSETQSKSPGKGQGKGKGKNKGRKSSKTADERPTVVAPVEAPAPETVSSEAAPTPPVVMVPEPARSAAPPAPAVESEPSVLVVPPADPEPAVAFAHTAAVVEPVEIPVEAEPDFSASAVPEEPAALEPLDLPSMAEIEPRAPVTEAVGEEEPAEARTCEVLQFPVPAAASEPELLDEAAIEELLRSAMAEDPLPLPEPLYEPPAFSPVAEEPESAVAAEAETGEPWTPQAVAFTAPDETLQEPPSLEPAAALETYDSFEASDPAVTEILEPIEPLTFEPLETIEPAEPIEPAASFEPVVLRPLRRLPPLAAWARVEAVPVETPQPTPATGEPESEMAALLATLRVPPQVVAVSYPRRPRIRWVRTAA